MRTNDYGNLYFYDKYKSIFINGLRSGCVSD